MVKKLPQEIDIALLPLARIILMHISETWSSQLVIRLLLQTFYPKVSQQISACIVQAGTKTKVKL